MASYEYDSQNQKLNRIAGGTLYADMPIGSEIEYAGTTAPTGFLKCDGSTYSQVTYPELYAILGTTTLPNKSGYIIKAKQIGVPADFASAIEDVIEEKFSYSTSEINTGKKWIDGKPIYRIVLVQSGQITTNTSYFATEMANLNIDTITLKFAKAKILSGGTVIRNNITEYYANTTDYFSVLVSELSVYVLFSANVLGNLEVTLEYTKTTD